MRLLRKPEADRHAADTANATRGIDMVKTRKTWQRPALVRMDAADAENAGQPYDRDQFRRQMGPS
jgi:hypothetical protein